MTGATVPLDEVVHFDVVTHSPSTGGITDADSAPTYDVFEEATDTPILDDQTMTKRTSLTGNYRGTFTASAANGFEVGKWYIVIATGVVGGVTGKVPALIFRLAPAESSAGVPKVDLSHWLGTAAATPTVAGVPEVDVTHYAGSTTDVSTMPASLAATLADTNELQTDWANGGRLDLIIDATLADTNELQTDWVNGGRLDLILDATATATALASLVTTVGVAGAGLTAADDAVIAAIAGLNNITAASVWAVGTRTLTAGTNIDGSTFTEIPWNADWDAEVQSEVADALTAYGVSTVTTAQVNTEVDTALSDWGKTGFSLAATGLNLVVPADPAAIPVLGTASIATWIGYFGAWTVNEVNSTANSVKLRNSADNADLASHTTSDDATTFSSSEPV
jgi:hypothetical protein